MPRAGRRMLAGVVALASVGVAPLRLEADVVSWDGGAGTMNWGDAGNWSGDALPAATDDIAFVESIGVATMEIQLGGSQTIRNLISSDYFDAKLLRIGTAADVAAGHALTLSGGRLNTYPSPAGVIVAVDVVFGSDGYINAATPTRIMGAIYDGGAGYGLHSDERLTLWGANTYSGPTSSNESIVFQGPNGSARNSPAFTVSSLALDNSQGVNNDRVNDAATITLRGGSLALLGHASDPVVETVGDVTFASGRNYLTTSRAWDATAEPVLSMRSLTRQNRAVGSVDGPGRILLSNPPVLVGNGATDTPRVGVVPYLFGDEYYPVAATYDAGPDGVRGNGDDLGLRGLRASELSTLAAATAGDNVHASGTAPEPIEGKIINSLAIANNGEFPITGTGTLGIRSGLILVNRLGSYGTASISGFDAVDFGEAEAILHNAVGDGLTPSFRIASPVRGSGGLTKSGYGTMRLAGPHEYSGTVTVLEGTLEVEHPSGLGTGGDGIVLDGGELEIVSTFETDRRISTRGWGAVRVGEDVTLTLTSPLVLDGNLRKHGGGTMVLTAPSTAPQHNVFIVGTLVLANDAGSATGDALLYVQDRSTLAGSGSALGKVTVYRGGRVSPGTVDDPVATMTAGELVLHDAASLRFHLGEVANADRLLVNGDVWLDGTLFVTALEGFGPGTYRLLDYGGSLTDNGLSVGVSAPEGYLYEIDTATAGQVNLIVMVPEPASAVALAMMWPLLGARALRGRTRLR